MKYTTRKMKAPTAYAQLICEGQCNPYISLLDLEVKEARAEYAYVLPLPTALVARLQRLVHTTHAYAGLGNQWTCCACHYGRRWGN